ncbi:DUF192 domain-containing protein [candidate division KSB1 bacterium]|nr:DUF192 domain-containing protein [candidate division KSB1 bacterium]
MGKKILLPLILGFSVILIIVFFREEGENGYIQGQKDDLVPLKVGRISIGVEIAQTPEARRRGLMFRQYLPPNEGMLFVFEYEGLHSFWMKNTFIQLDIAFINIKGEIVDIQRMEPLDDTKVYVPPTPILYALEMNQGWFEENGIRVGDKVEF